MERQLGGKGITMNFGEMKREDKLALLTAWVDGEEIEFHSSHDDKWRYIKSPLWDKNTPYRVKLSSDSINWDHVPERYKFMARCDDGRVFLFESYPHKMCDGWVSTGDFAKVAHSSYKQGNAHWTNSVVCRNGESK